MLGTARSERRLLGRPAILPSRSTWDRRSLYEFGEAPLDAVLGNYDLVIFDHPFIGDIAEGALMVPFDDHLSAEEKAFFERDSVGKSWQSYQRDGRQWALPIDAACQVASYRPDLLARYRRGAGEPSTRCWRSAARLRAGRANGSACRLVPTDAMCLILTLRQPAGRRRGLRRSGRRSERAVGAVARAGRACASAVTDWNPIRCYDHMIAQDDVVYVPFAFGYVNYASRTDGPHLRLRRRSDARIAAGALLGGAGIGVSAQSQNREAAIAYARHLCSPAGAAERLCRSRRPAGIAVGLAATRASTRRRGGFFADTLETIQASYLRRRIRASSPSSAICAPHAAAAIAGEMSAGELAVLPQSPLPGVARPRSDEPHGDVA